MSCNESKTVIRAEIPELKGKNHHETYQYFKHIIGEAGEVDEWEGKIEYFIYDGNLQPVHDYNSGKWGIDLVLHHESDYKTYIDMKTNGLSMDEFKEKVNILVERFGIDPGKARIMSYTWYNGVDEPIYFE